MKNSFSIFRLNGSFKISLLQLSQYVPRLFSCLLSMLIGFGLTSCSGKRRFNESRLVQIREESVPGSTFSTPDDYTKNAPEIINPWFQSTNPPILEIRTRHGETFRLLVNEKEIFDEKGNKIGDWLCLNPNCATDTDKYNFYFNFFALPDLKILEKPIQLSSVQVLETPLNFRWVNIPKPKSEAELPKTEASEFEQTLQSCTAEAASCID